MARTVLVADDSPTIQNRAQGILKGAGFEVETVSNGVAAIKKLSKVRPGLVLADISMPGKDGYEVCDFVKKSADFQQIPVLLIASEMEPYDEQRAAKVRADGKVMKPFDSQALISAVSKYVAQAPAAPPMPERVEPPPAAPPPEEAVEATPMEFELAAAPKAEPLPPPPAESIAFEEPAFGQPAPPATLVPESEPPPPAAAAPPPLPGPVSLHDLPRPKEAPMPEIWHAAEPSEPAPYEAPPLETFEPGMQFEEGPVQPAEDLFPTVGAVQAEEPFGSLAERSPAPLMTQPPPLETFEPEMHVAEAEAPAEAAEPATREAEIPVEAMQGESLEAPSSPAPPAVEEPILVEEPAVMPAEPPAPIAEEQGEPYQAPAEVAEPVLKVDSFPSTAAPEVPPAWVQEPESPPPAAASFESPPLAGREAEALAEQPEPSLFQTAEAVETVPPAPPHIIDPELVYSIVHKVAEKMSPPAVTPGMVDDIARKLAEEILAELIPRPTD